MLPNYGQKIKQIMQEERRKTCDKIEELPEALQVDAYQIFEIIQAAINSYVGQQDRAIDGRLLQTVTGLMSDEAGRIFKRMQDGGLLYPRSEDDHA